MSFGEKLAKLRKEKGLSQEELAQELNVSRQAVSKWESNNAYPETDKIVAICKLFNTSMDEIIGLKNSPSKSENKFTNYLNKYFDLFIKGIRMFYSMTFKQKIKCLIEFCFYAIVLILMFMGINYIILIILRNILDILPISIMYSLVNAFQGMLLLIYTIIGIYILCRLYKIRYLDYYECVNPKIIIKENEEEFTKGEKLNIKEEKIIIRDANRNFNPFIWMQKLLIIFGKLLISFIAIPICIMFIFLVAAFIFDIYYITHGIIILYIALLILSAILFTYLLIELIFRVVFNMEIKARKYLILFITSILVFGISSGLFLGEIAKYKITNVTTMDDLDTEIVIPMDNRLVVHFLGDADIIFEERSDIKIDFYVFNKDILRVIPESYSTLGFFDNGLDYLIEGYDVVYEDLSVNTIISRILDSIKNKEIYIYDDEVSIKIHISKENYEELVRRNRELGFRV